MSKAEIIDLEEARAQRRLANYRRKISGVIASNQRAISRLYDSGALFSRDGAKAGRDLLLAHQNLLRVRSLLETLGEDGMVPAPRNVEKIVAIYDELAAERREDRRHL